jgi:hypothetical protein
MPCISWCITAILAYTAVAAISAAAVADETREAVDPALVKRIDELLLELDAEEFQAREEATKALGEIGEPARRPLEKLAAEPPSPEVRIRAAKLLRDLDRAALRRSAVTIDDLCEQARLANAGELDVDKLGQLLERLVAVLRDATGRDDLTVPLKPGDLRRAAADTSVQNALIVTRRGRITSVRNSIVLADVAFDATSVDSSIIIARVGASVSSVRNSIVIAGYDVSGSSCDGSVLLTSGTIDTSFPRNTILGAGQKARASIAREGVVFVNTAAGEGHHREAPREVQTEGLVLSSEEWTRENPLADKITVTASLGEAVLFRRNARGGELVARLDQPIEHPDGGVLPETKGWQVCYTGHRRRTYVIFTDGKQFMPMPVAGR